MTKRLKILLIAGGIAVSLGALTCWSLLLWARGGGWYPSSGTADSRYVFGEETKPQIVFFGVYPRSSIRNAICLEVRHGVPFVEGDAKPIDNVAGYVSAELGRRSRDFVVVSASRDEKFGDVVQVVDACRTTQIRQILINYHPQPE